MLKIIYKPCEIFTSYYDNRKSLFKQYIIQNAVFLVITICFGFYYIRNILPIVGVGIDLKVLKPIVWMFLLIASITIPFITSLITSVVFNLVLSMCLIQNEFKDIFSITILAFPVVILGYIFKIGMMQVIFHELNYMILKIDIFNVWYLILCSIGIFIMLKKELNDKEKKRCKFVIGITSIIICIVNFIFVS